MQKFATFALAATVAAGIMMPTAHAEPSSFQFLSPSGNVGCQMGTTPEGSSFAWCKVNEHTWSAPQSPSCPRANIPGAVGEPGGENLQLAEGRPPCFGFMMNQLFFDGQYAPPMLAYGDQRSAGTITCSAEPVGVTCSDAKTGYSFQVSRETYTLTPPAA
ncbi:conserved exported hypothetical protein [uncultured Mycobacterium sp.]|uniref:Ig-like domain-containing protein n=1 Tax=uncultured Mycobacterium sp. TaxID=171292 RepID=A0A1Y5NYJ0_9MYCO|nr:conserved exported hypothetical protein [uncultured Mycobacterium sp.]